jgi:hypothetical protein
MREQPLLDPGGKLVCEVSGRALRPLPNRVAGDCDHIFELQMMAWVLQNDDFHWLHAEVWRLP